MAQSQQKLITYEDYAAMPDDGRRYEVLDGRLEMVPAPNVQHQRSCLRSVRRLAELVEKLGLGEVFVSPIDVILDTYVVVQPDIVFVARENAGRVSRRGIEGPPDLVIEIVSPYSASRDYIRKLAIYERFGVPEYWIANPTAGSVTVLVLENGRYEEKAEVSRTERIVSKVLPGLELCAQELFGDAPASP